MDFNPDSTFWALEVPGYGLVSLAALFIVPAFSGAGSCRWRMIVWLPGVNAALNLLGGIAYLLTANPMHALAPVSLGCGRLLSGCDRYAGGGV